MDTTLTLPPSIESSIGSLTETEFVAWCDEDVKAEYVDGRIVVASPASIHHERIFKLLLEALDLYAIQHGGEVLGSQVQIRLRTGLRRVPDLVFVGPDQADAIRESHIEGPPLLIVEVVSSDSVERDWQEKYEEYEAAGVREYWVVDPLTRRLDVYVLNEQGRYDRVPLEKGVCRSVALPGFWLRPAWLWQDPPPNVVEVARELNLL